MNPNRYDLILLFSIVSGIYYVIDETLNSTNNAPKPAETLPVLFSVDASPQDNADHRQEKRLSIRTQHAPAPLKRFGSVVELVKWAHAGGAAAWRRAERLKHARWQLEVDEYRVAHGLVGDVE
jgi:hypothetical protein